MCQATGTAERDSSGAADLSACRARSPCIRAQTSPWLQIFFNLTTNAGKFANCSVAGSDGVVIRGVNRWSRLVAEHAVLLTAHASVSAKSAITGQVHFKSIRPYFQSFTVIRELASCRTRTNPRDRARQLMRFPSERIATRPLGQLERSFTVPV